MSIARYGSGTYFRHLCMTCPTHMEIREQGIFNLQDISQGFQISDLHSNVAVLDAGGLWSTLVLGSASMMQSGQLREDVLT